MTVEEFFPQTSQRKVIDIGNGLIMRWSTKKDTENISLLVEDAFRWLPAGDPFPQDKVPGPNEFMRAAVRRLLSGKSSIASEFDFALVEDTRREEGKNPIVSCVSLQRHEAYYGSTVLTFGMLELIATDTEYRNKGLVRRLLLDMVHPESEARGDVLQFIPGIPNFYRQFGYDYGLYCYPAARIENADIIPPLGKDKSEPYILRQAKLDDIDYLVQMSKPEVLHNNTTIANIYTRRYWQYTVHDAIEDKQHRFDADRETNIITEVESGKPIGFTIASHNIFGPQLEALSLDEGLASHMEVKDSVLRQLFDQARIRQDLKAKAYEAAQEEKRKTEAEPEKTTEVGDGQKKKIDNDDDAKAAPVSNQTKPGPLSYGINLPGRHPLCTLLGSMAKRSPIGYGLYTRIHSYPNFIKAVTPELEKRLADSALAGVTGRLRLNFYRKVEGSSGKGLEIVFEKGKIVDAKEWDSPSPEKALEERMAWKMEDNAPVLYSAGFAPLTFTNLLTGKDSLDDLVRAYGECGVRNDATTLLLNTLFPKSQYQHHFDIFIW
ncbi:hypothetical protein BGZ80_003401 [Entomortierella chlamydospora]|uniref:Uncharacterized protein n=1 Tax=Entomortierella chlamydospora TaxID=101097 RepID=A0A9P6MPA1_9FUNG|nr:hypothetical protein BGZ79_001706 [Entomortierella chlamydospora]KAG0008464.1 hypothetical protein BGZ80_003401 [Entomortierella chlamydospora]